MPTMNALSMTIKSPLMGVFLGILSIIIAIFLFFISQNKVIPKYAINKPKLIAEITNETPRLKLLWDKKEINNIYSIDIVIWNAGNDFIDNNSISKTDSIRVEYSDNINLLYSSFSKTSRDNLRFKAVNIGAEKTIKVELVGDEALEKHDGGMLSLLYTGPKNENFIVKGRIKGSKTGFSKEKWPITLNNKKPTLTIILITASLFSFVIGVYAIYRGVNRIRKIPYDGAKKYGAIFLIEGIILILFFLLILYQLYDMYFSSFEWLL